MSGAAIVGVTFGLGRYSYGLFLPEIRADYGLSSGTLGLIATAATATYLAATVVAPALTIRSGARTPVLAGGLVAAAGMAVVALSTSALVLAVGVVVAGASAGLAFTPYSAVVARRVAPVARERSLTIISAGTGLGVVVAAPLALAAGDSWRAAWAVFAVIAIVVSVWSARVLGRDPVATSPSPASPVRLPAGAWRMLGAAALAGLGSAIYWTFAVDLVARAGALPRSSGSALLAGVGIAGIAGGLAGDLVARLGLRRALRAVVVVLAASLAVLPLAASSWVGVVCSSLMFGAAYIFVTGALAIWSSRLYADAPSHGLATMLVALFAGQILGPTLAGVVADRWDLDTAFFLGAAVVMASLALAPPHHTAVRHSS